MFPPDLENLSLSRDFLGGGYGRRSLGGKAASLSEQSARLRATRFGDALVGVVACKTPRYNRATAHAHIGGEF
jgi:hypothetical protein